MRTFLTGSHHFWLHVSLYFGNSEKSQERSPVSLILSSHPHWYRDFEGSFVPEREQNASFRKKAMQSNNLRRQNYFLIYRAHAHRSRMFITGAFVHMRTYVNSGKWQRWVLRNVTFRLLTWPLYTLAKVSSDLQHTNSRHEVAKTTVSSIKIPQPAIRPRPNQNWIKRTSAFTCGP